MRATAPRVLALCAVFAIGSGPYVFGSASSWVRVSASDIRQGRADELPQPSAYAIARIVSFWTRWRKANSFGLSARSGLTFTTAHPSSGAQRRIGDPSFETSVTRATLFESLAPSLATASLVTGNEKDVSTSFFTLANSLSSQPPSLTIWMTLLFCGTSMKPPVGLPPLRRPGPGACVSAAVATIVAAAIAIASIELIFSVLFSF